MAFRGIDEKTINELKTNLFIETGTLDGDGINYALECGLTNIISIDIDHTDIYKKFEKYDHVKLIIGDSGSCLWDVIKDKNQKIMFWLDAHADLIEPLDDSPWNPICPILEELEQIKKHNINDHNILIDDITPIIKLPKISKPIIEKMLLNINSNYRISYVDTGGTQTLIASTNSVDYNRGLFAYR